ncbi:flagellar basal body rod C-terminal domain-containing protein [Desulfobotulus mexicanus]|uniref:Flagellar biosynthesis protein FlgG n=1 Tax=Desulfobotulus mexicanus TaxID=2586642 RepID=A0A5Q4VIF9_9BACT|nr:flagellar basal body rod C-terminal domain-containing protein [Desulfobotulus mexicanus]TYT75950.1 flagellar biosynthesis protein FlgG [Desulfobotulus mexicanus]
MLPSIGVGATAMRAIGTRFSATAHNVANVNTDGFRPQNAVLVEGPRGAGPEVHVTPKNAFPPEQTAVQGVEGRAEPPVLPSETDLARETVHSIKDSRGYAANARQISVSDEMMGSLLSIRE